LVPGTLCYWKCRVAKRKVESILDMETLAIQYGNQVGTYLNHILVKLGLNKSKLKPITHISSGNRHANARLNVIWQCLREGYDRNLFGLRHISNEYNLSDTLTKVKSNVSDLFRKCLRLGKLYLPI